MRHLRLYENLDEPEVGDYAICFDVASTSSDSDYFFEHNIGQIINIGPSPFLLWSIKYWVKYENFPYNSQGIIQHPVPFSKDEILHFSKSKAELELILTAKQYNL